MMLARRLLVIATLLALLAQAASAREWTDSTGKFKVEAELVKVVGDTVFLKKLSDGATIQVPVARLSDPDQAYLASLQSPTPAPTSAGEDRALPLHTAGCVGLLVVDPKPLLQHEGLSGPPLKDFIDQGVAAAGIDFRKLDRITVFSLKPEMPVDPTSQKPNAVVVAEFLEAVDVAPLLEKIPMEFEATTVAGKPCHKAAIDLGPMPGPMPAPGMALLVCVIDEKTLAFAADEKFLAATLTATSDDADLTNLLAGTDPENEIRYVLNMAPIKDVLKQAKATLPPMPGEAAAMLDVIEKIDSVTFTTEMDGPPAIEVVLQTADASTAGELEKAIKDGLAQLPELMKTATEAAAEQGPQPGAMPMNPAMMAPMLSSMAEKIDEFLAFEQQEGALKVAVKFPPDSPPLVSKLVEAAGFGAMMMQMPKTGGTSGPPQ